MMAPDRHARDRFKLRPAPPPPLPDLPTTALPGTEEKVNVLAERARLGETLWHPLDRTWGNSPPEEAANTMPVLPAIVAATFTCNCSLRHLICKMCVSIFEVHVNRSLTKLAKVFGTELVVHG